MTNGTVAGVQPGTAERTMTLHYADGDKTVRVPEGVPVRETSPGSFALLVPGAKVTLATQLRDGRRTAVRVIVGKGGYEPPL